MKIGTKVIFTGNYNELKPGTIGTVYHDQKVRQNEIAVDFGPNQIWAVKKDEIQPVKKSFKQKLQLWFHSCDKHKKLRLSLLFIDDGKMYGSPHEWAVCKICGRKWIYHDPILGSFPR